jgi:hypothetical protein
MANLRPTWLYASQMLSKSFTGYSAASIDESDAARDAGKDPQVWSPETLDGPSW